MNINTFLDHEIEEILQKQKLKVEDFKFLRVLGKGSYSEVNLVILNWNNKKYALKIIDKVKIQDLNKHHYYIIEKSILFYFNNPNIVKLYHTFEDDTHLYFVLEYVESKTLYNFIQENKIIEIDTVKFIIKKLVSILKILRENGITHRDLKPENILINDNLEIKLIDFGTSKIIENNINQLLIEYLKDNSNEYNKLNNNITINEMYWKKTSLAGSPFYIAPEIINNIDIHYSSDYWSWGIIIFQMIHGKFPFSQKYLFSNMEHIGVEIQFKKKIDLNTIDLISKLLIINPYKRLGMEDNNKDNNFDALVNHPFFKSKKKHTKDIKLKLTMMLNKTSNISNSNKNYKNTNINTLTSNSKIFQNKTIIYEGYIILKKFKIFKLRRYLILDSTGIISFYNMSNKFKKKIKINIFTKFKKKRDKIKIKNNFFNSIKFKLLIEKDQLKFYNLIKNI